ncbi:MAG TPA: queuosine salvage family protein [Chloroflexota bacterium]|nr:queuosine salvage family protein [Chloroflexota bacterium]
MSIDFAARDPLGVLASTLPVVEQANSVRIEPANFPRVAASLRESSSAMPEWRTFPHWWSDDPALTTMYVLVLDALNFCFWGEPRWTISTPQGELNGYFALAAALRRAIEQEHPLLNPAWLASVSSEQLEKVLDGDNKLPLMEERAANLRELGTAILTRLGGESLRLISEADGEAGQIAASIARTCPSFLDLATLDGQEVRFFKRAQILASDLAAALGASPPHRITGLDQLTAFADYKVPQVLRELGLLSYAPRLARRIDRQVEIPPGAREEIEIRAATIWAVESLRLELQNQGTMLQAYEIDWLLWNLGQSLENPRPYHRTRTIYY